MFAIIIIMLCGTGVGAIAAGLLIGGMRMAARIILDDHNPMDEAGAWAFVFMGAVGGAISTALMLAAGAP